ncbi:hypothetical protein E3P86_03504 [Wallemia ichthyophaga]|uniref:Protein AF-9 homolog n=1 Tax=Wallemia ichthyophaga TaxID=245174 RepID=A0A4T0IKY7_WALIC|nr:hypothetical protein E3P86_03504 [Wallemia ichthyophaga]
MSANNKRIRSLQISRPVVIGNTARAITPEEREKDATIPPTHTHRWTISVRSPSPQRAESSYDEGCEGIHDEGLSTWLRRVQIRLHDTYKDNNRTLDKPPFVVSETGWGEFEVVIRLHFPSDAGERPMVLHHMLKLHPWNVTSSIPRDDGLPPTVHSWQYDEIVFSDPHESFFHLLTCNPPPPLPDSGPFSKQDIHSETTKLNKARRTTVAETTKLRDELIRMEAELKAVRRA